MDVDNMVSRISKESLQKSAKLILIACVITIVSGLAFALGLLLTSIPSRNEEIWNPVIVSISLIISFGVLPYILFKYYLYETISIQIEVKKSIRYLVEITILFFIFNFYFGDWISLLIGLFIATFEEVLFRYFIYEYLKKNAGVLFAVVFNSLVFGLLFHFNSDLLLNMLLRFPLGILLSLIKRYIGLPEAILSHWLYNTIVVFVKLPI
jgi:membrane protease YdiL (CAAX protease family)